MKTSKARTSKKYEEIAQKLNELSRTNHSLFEYLLSNITDERLRLLLRQRHGYNLSWPMIFEDLKNRGMYYSARHIFRLYAKAISQMEQELRIWEDRKYDKSNLPA